MLQNDRRGNRWHFPNAMEIAIARFKDGGFLRELIDVPRTSI